MKRIAALVLVVAVPSFVAGGYLWEPLLFHLPRYCIFDIAVIDGDTLRCEGRIVRLLGYDTPEPRPEHAKCGQEEVLGRIATCNLERRVRANRYAVVPTYKRDEHVRHEADLYLDGFLAGRLLESKGLALSWASLLKDEANQIFLSAVTAWEIATKVRTGKLDFESAHLADFDGMARAMSFEPLAITARHVVAGARLPGEHTDPFDRLLAGQAETGGLRLVSADPAFEVLGIPALWA